MPRAKKTDARDGLVKPGEPPTLQVQQSEHEPVGRSLARLIFDPQTRHANLAVVMGSGMFGDQLRPDITESSAALMGELAKASSGNLAIATRMHLSQAITLDTLFTEMARRAALNFGEYPDAVDRYMRLALKAQSASRASLEALARLHQPREQIVKHVHVSDGGQAVVADHFHTHAGGARNDRSIIQSHATELPGVCPPVRGSDEAGHELPVTSSGREGTVQDARS